LLPRRSLVDPVPAAVTAGIGAAETAISSTPDVVQGVASSASDAVGSVTSSVANAIQSIASSAGNLAGDAAGELAKVESNIADFYIVGLWGYCKGSINETTSTVTNCTSPSSGFWFNFTDVLGLESSLAEKLFPSEVLSAMNIYRVASKGAIIAYITAFSATALALFVGITATLSRWGSCLTSVCAIVSFSSSVNLKRTDPCD
jgi:hypothetical protein